MEKFIKDNAYPLLAAGLICLMAIAMGLEPMIAFFAIMFLSVVYIIGDKFIHVKYTRASEKKYGFLEEESLFNNSILVLVAVVIKTDGKPKESELNYVRTALGIHFTEERVEQHIRQIDKLLDENLQYGGICNVIDRNFRFNEKVQLLHFLVGIVCSDGLLSVKEERVLKNISRKMRVPESVLTGIFRMFNFVTEEEVHNRHKKRQQKSTRTSSYKLAQAFEILGLELNASDSQIKKAYRKLAMKHHPDRLAHLAEEHQKSAKEKFQAISDAYEFIKSSKGFN